MHLGITAHKDEQGRFCVSQFSQSLEAQSEHFHGSDADRAKWIALGCLPFGSHLQLNCQGKLLVCGLKQEAPV